MTRYEELIKKADRCMQCAIATTGRMRAIWRKHAEALKQLADSLTVAQAKEIVPYVSKT